MAISLTACLAWYEEPPEMLYECVLSLAGLCDRLVAVDGGYLLIPDANAASDPEQEDAINDAASRAGIALDLVVPRTPWVGQVAKRDYLMRRAARGSDWLLVVDADYLLTADTEAVHAELAASRLDAYDLDFYTPLPEGPYDLDAVAAELWHRERAGKTVKERLLLRALPGFRVTRFHWYYSALKPSPAGRRRRVCLCDCGRKYPYAPSGELQSRLTIVHRALLRDQAMVDRNRSYIDARAVVIARDGHEP